MTQDVRRQVRDEVQKMLQSGEFGIRVFVHDSSRLPSAVRTGEVIGVIDKAANTLRFAMAYENQWRAVTLGEVL